MHVLCIHNKFILRRPIGDGRYYSRDPKCSKVVEDLTWCSFLLTSDTDIYTTVHNTNHLLPVFSKEVTINSLNLKPAAQASTLDTVT